MIFYSLFDVEILMMTTFQSKHQASEIVRVKTEQKFVKSHKLLLLIYRADFFALPFAIFVCLTLYDSSVIKTRKKDLITEDTQLDLLCCLTFGIDLLIVYLLISFFCVTLVRIDIR